MAGRVLHILSQRPGRTGSGVTLDSLVRLAARAGWEQMALVGVPAGDAAPAVGGLPASAVRAVTFADQSDQTPDLGFPVPGMSDVMPYLSSVWSTLTPTQLDSYREVWRANLAAAVADFQPDLIHVNHIWIVAALVKDVAPGLPAVATCHATGLRQMELCPHLAAEVIRGSRRLDRFCVLHDEHRDRLAARLEVAHRRIAVVGVGYRDDLFHGPPEPDPVRRDEVLYVGKASRAKGVPWLLDAVARLAPSHPDLHLHVAGGGAGAEAEALAGRMDAMAPHVARHGPLDQAALARLMRRCTVMVLPSFYEGIPLVLAEAAACGCRLVATALPGVVTEIVPRLSDRIDLVPLPRLRGIDEPEPADLDAFSSNLAAALAAAVRREPAGTPPPEQLAPFTWDAVFARVEAVWRDLSS